MILVDSGVWIAYFRGTPNQHTDKLDALLGAEPLGTFDIALTEVLQGFTAPRAFAQALRLMTSLAIVEIGGRDIAIQAARNYRTLRARGVTVLKTIDNLIATRCIQDGHALLFNDHDFDPFVIHLGLKSALS